MNSLKKIPLVDLHIQYEALRKDIDACIQRVIDKGCFILGKEVEAFETAFAKYCNVPHCIGVSSGTDSLEQILSALRIGAGDEVITVSHTFIATVEAIYAVGAKPVFVDVLPDTLLMDPSRVEAAITPRTKAIIPVHLYGQMADMDSLMTIATKHGLKVVEDSAQAHGATYNGRHAGSVGDAGSFSFYPGKNLGAYGDGGGITCRDEALAVRIRKARNHGRTGKYEHEFIGRNARMDGIQGAVLATKLPHLDSWNENRRRVAARYTQALIGLLGVSPVAIAPLAQSVYHLYVIRVPRRDSILEFMQAQGIEVGIHYPIPVHLQPACKDLGYREGQFPVTEAAAKEILSLPIFPEMTDEQIDRVISVFKEALKA
jgi:dTDP-4-amino-4,6-dideoxygalactose transaminase